MKSELDQDLRAFEVFERKLYKHPTNREVTQFSLGGSLYKVDRSAINVLSPEILRHHRYSVVPRPPTSPYRILNLGSGTGVQIVGVHSFLRKLNYFPLEITETNVTSPPHRVIHAGSSRTTYVYKESVFGETVANQLDGPFDFILSDRVIEWSKHPGVFLDNLHQLTADRGLVVLTTPMRHQCGKVMDILRDSPYGASVYPRYIPNIDGLQDGYAFFMV